MASKRSKVAPNLAPNLAPNGSVHVKYLAPETSKIDRLKPFLTANKLPDDLPLISDESRRELALINAKATRIWASGVTLKGEVMSELQKKLP